MARHVTAATHQVLPQRSQSHPSVRLELSAHCSEETCPDISNKGNSKGKGKGKKVDKQKPFRADVETTKANRQLRVALADINDTVARVKADLNSAVSDFETDPERAQYDKEIAIARKCMEAVELVGSKKQTAAEDLKKYIAKYDAKDDTASDSAGSVAKSGKIGPCANFAFLRTLIEIEGLNEATATCQTREELIKAHRLI